MKPTIAVIAPGAMGAAVAARLVENGADVITTLSGRSQASAKRAAEAGMRAVSDTEIPSADLILSIVPPSDALGLAERLSPVLRSSIRKPLYVDCNAVSPETAKRVGGVIAETGSPFADGGIIGGPPRKGYAGPTLYVSGEPAVRVEGLARGVVVRAIDGPVGAASALKMSYAAITKGLTALGTASMLAATRAGAADALHRELSESQPMLLAWLGRSVPDMFSKAYRFVGEMEEISSFMASEGARDIYAGIAKLYREVAADKKGDNRDIEALKRFLSEKKGT
jgi:3-hydroxyisobutyrate dehydrogenase-like beta-hydroxyacid dehydrogenase